MTTINNARAMLKHYLVRIAGDTIEPGSDALTAQVQAEMDAWDREHGLNPTEWLKDSAETVGLSVNEYAWLLDYLAKVGDQKSVVHADTVILNWAFAAAAAFESHNDENQPKSVLISAHATTTRVIAGDR